MTGRSSMRLLFTIATSLVILLAAVSMPRDAVSLPLFPPTARLTVNPNPALVGQTVTFDGSGSSGDGAGGTIVKHEWDLDGSPGFELDTGTTPTTARPYDAGAVITVSLRVTDSDDDTDVESVSLKVNTPPTASVIFEPSTPGVNEQITFSSTSSDPEGPIAAEDQTWDFDRDGVDDAVGQTVTHSFASAGNKRVRLKVFDSDGARSITTRDFLVQANPPTATFTFSPGTPLTNEAVSFDGSGSSAPAGETIEMTWDFDGDGQFGDAGDAPSFSYPTPGPRTVGLRVDASGGGFDIATQVVPVANRAPDASINFAPKPPRAGSPVQLISTSFDPDGPIVDQAWDLDSDGEYDDAGGPTAEKTFPEAGTYSVWLRVRDAFGDTDELRTLIEVEPRILDLLNPFPVVRLTGSLKSNGKTKIERLTVLAPEGSDVVVRCKGKSCPFHKREHAAKRNRIRFHGIERVLKPGVVIKAFVTEREKIGKFTSFRLRADKAPKRADRCVKEERRKPFPCPRA